jgi:deoxyribonuclease V
VKVLRPLSKYVWTNNWRTAEFEQAVFAQDVELRPLDLTQIGAALAIGVGYSERAQEAVAIGVPCTPMGDRLDDRSYLANVTVDFPYQPGLFAYREAPAICQMLEAVDFSPDLLLMDTQGIAHPRRFGLASHIGLLTGLATIGVTRKPLRGRTKGRLPDEGVEALFDRGSRIGGVLCRSRTDPLFASPGHRTDVATVIDWLERLPKRGRGMPEAMWSAHQLANQQARRKT